MVNWTEEQLMEAMERQSPQKSTDPVPSDPGLESDLQRKIEKYLTENGFYYHHDRSRGVNRAGQPDLVVALPGGRTVWLELKAAKGRMSPDQRRTHQMLLALGHEFYEVRSYRAFLEIVGKHEK